MVGSCLFDAQARSLMDFPLDLFDGAPRQDQREAWENLDEATQRRTCERLEVILEWEAAETGLTAKDAARRLGLGLSRFYKMAADWRATGDFEVLGTIRAKHGKRRSKLDPEVVNALQSVVADVVARNEDATVSHLVRLMVAESGVEDLEPPRRLPSSMKLREIVEAEMRRSAALAKAGNQIAFDCCALTWAATPDQPFCLFLVIDRGTRAVLGHHVGLFEEGLKGFAAAASDALDNMSDLDLPWSHDMLGMQMVVGAKREPYDRLSRRLERELSVSAKLASSEKRFGRYVLELLGPRLGRVVFAPRSTGFEADMEPDLRVDASMPLVNGEVDVRSPEWVAETVASDLSYHNMTEVGRSLVRATSDRGIPPRRLRDLLEQVSSATT